MWVQVYGLSLDMMTEQNAKHIGSSMGCCKATDPTKIMNQGSFLRFQVEISAGEPLKARFWWYDAKGNDKWASIKYERLSDFCYRCGKLRHTSNNCMDDVVPSKTTPGFPLYEPWLSGTRPRMNNRCFQVGGATDRITFHVMQTKQYGGIL